MFFVFALKYVIAPFGLALEFDIFIPAKSRNFFHSWKIVYGAKILSSSSHVGNCIQLRHMVGTLDLDVVFHHIF